MRLVRRSFGSVRGAALRAVMLFTNAERFRKEVNQEISPDEFNMGTYPKVKFVLDERHEREAAMGFLRDRTPRARAMRFLNMFLPVQLHFLLANNFSDKERDKIIASYVADFYKYEGNKYKRRLKVLQADWVSVESRYFRLVDRLFHKRPWPKGKYIGYATIFLRYPRFVSEKTFFVPIEDKNIPNRANRVAAHELLHFMFFDYLKAHYGLNEHSRIKGKSPDYIWQVSEAFNSVIEGWAPYQRLFKTESRPYPETIEVFKTMEAQWKRKQDVDALLAMVLKPARQRIG